MKEYIQNEKELKDFSKKIMNTDDNSLKDNYSSYISILQGIFNKCFSSPEITKNEHNKCFCQYQYHLPMFKLELIGRENYKSASEHFLNALLYLCKDFSFVQKKEGLKNSAKHYLNVIKNSPKIKIFEKEFFKSIESNIFELYSELDKINDKDFKYLINNSISIWILKISTAVEQVYTDERLDILKDFLLLIGEISKKIDKDDYFSKHHLLLSKYITKKRELFYYINKFIPSIEKPLEESQRNELMKNITSIIRELEELVNQDKKTVNNLNNLGNCSDYIKIMNLLDRETVKYFSLLYEQQNIIKSIRQLNKIFELIKTNWQIISKNAPEILDYYFSESLLINSVLNLKIMSNEFLRYGRFIRDDDWKKGIFDALSKHFNDVVEKIFKYQINNKYIESFRIIITQNTGKFIELIVYYLLQQFIEKQILSDNSLKDIKNNELKELFNTIASEKNKENVIWNYKDNSNTGNSSTGEIDIYIKNKCALLLKSGIISESDRNSLEKDIEFSIKLKVQLVFIIIDLTKNPEFYGEILNRIKNEDKNINNTRILVLDLENLLKELIRITNTIGKEKKVFEIEKDNVLSLAGFLNL